MFKYKCIHYRLTSFYCQFQNLPFSNLDSLTIFKTSVPERGEMCNIIKCKNLMICISNHV